MRENSLSGSANLFKGVNVIDIRTKWFGNFHRSQKVRVIESFEKSRVREIGSKIVELE